MIEISWKETLYTFDITVEGHANYAEYGKDIVCSAVSILVQTLIKNLDDITCQYSVDMKEGYVHITGKGIDGRKSCDVIRSGIELLRDAYPEYIGVSLNLDF